MPIHKQVIEVQAEARSEPPPKPPIYMDPQLWIIIGLGLVVGIVKLCNLSFKKQTIGRARWATSREIQTANKKGYQQVIAQKLSQPALWINKPKGLEVKDGKIIIPYDGSTLFIPDVGGSIFLFGSADAGKSYSIKDPLQFSAIYQGHSIIDFDAKANEQVPPSSMSLGLALKLGYEAFVLDPTGGDTDCFNIWDSVRHPEDTDTALKIGDSFILNMGLDSGGGNAGFSIYRVEHC